MRFVFKCLAVKHVSGRVSLTPLLHPELAVHAVDIARAVEELTLALDDRISRAHPRRLPEFARAAVGELVGLDVPAVRVWRTTDEEQRTLRLSAVVAPGHKPFTEVHVPRLSARFWLAGKQLLDAAGELCAEELEDEDEDDVLALRSEGQESLLELIVEATPLALSDLRRRELHLDERPPPRPADAEPGDADEDDEDEDSRAEDDDWADERRRRRKKPPAPKRPATPTLSKIGVPWHELAHAGALDPAWEVDVLVDELVARLDTDRPDPVVLVGPAGAGKSTVLAELARRLVALAGPRAEREALRPFFLVDGARLIAGDGAFGGWQRQVLDAWREAVSAKAILHLGRVIDLLDAGKSAHSDDNVAQLLGSMLLAREVAVLGEATPEEWAELERRNVSFARSFAVLRVEDPPPARTRAILSHLAAALAEERGLTIAPDAVSQALALVARFVPEGALVGNAASFLRRLVDTRAHARATSVQRGDALALFSSESGVPEKLLRDDLPLDEDEVRAFLAARVHGQDAAVARAARAVSVIKANLADRRRPSAVLLFAGPTGVGKTELCKALAELVFGSRERMIRLDMGELAGPDALGRLLGEAGAPGALPARVRRQPFSLVLLDEIEKAHPAVFDALLGVLGEGRLTDASGKLADFRACIIVMTSNLGAESLRARAGFGGEAALLADAESHYRGEAQRFFRPELWNRIDDLVVFAPLGEREIRRIVDRELERVSRREGLHRRDVSLEVADGARTALAARGFDPRYGARPLKRAIERELVVPLAGWLAGHAKAGASRIVAERGESGLSLSAESLGAGEGVSRAGIEAVLTRAANLRAEVRRFTRVPAMRRLRRELSFFDRLSRQPSFWHDRAVADETARAAAEGRELERELEGLEKQAEASEDLAYEAYYNRQAEAAASLDRDLDDLRAALLPLVIRLFASLFPPRNTVALELVPSRGAWAHVVDLVGTYSRWLKIHKASGECHVLIEKPPPAEKSDRPKAKKAEKQPSGWVWKKREPGGDAEKPVAAVLYASGAKAIMLLAAEHGVHRFVDGGETRLVRARFLPRPGPPAGLPGLPELDKDLPTDEIRRIWPQKGVVRDLRLERDLALVDGFIDYDTLIELYLRHRLFGSHEEEPT